MRIEFEPKPDGMQHVNMLFCDAEPDAEDAWIREQLEAYPVPPKRYLEAERDGRPYRVWQYGECVIADPLFDIQRFKAVVDRLRELYPDDLDEAALRRPAVAAEVSALGREFTNRARYTYNLDRQVAITVDDTGLRELVLARLAGLGADE